MEDGLPALSSRRTVLAASVASLAGFAGCSGLEFSTASPATISRIVIRSYTGRDELLTLVLVYASRDGSLKRPVRPVTKINKGEGTTVIDEFSGEPGFYNLIVIPENYNTYGIRAFNSYSELNSDGDLQFEVIIKEFGNVRIGIDDAGSEVSLP